MSKKIILAALISGVMSSSVFAAGSGTVSFQGEIIDAPCGISADTASQIVPMGKISNASLADGGKSTAQNFNIQLVDCDVSTLKTVDVSFTGGAIGTDSDMLAIQGSASGAGVVVIGMNGEKVKFDGSSVTNQNLLTGRNTLNFSAYLQGLSGQAIGPGDFTAVSNFLLEYK